MNLCKDTTMPNSMFYVVLQVPTEYKKFKCTKCTVIVADAFGEEVQKRLNAGTYIMCNDATVDPQ